MDITELLNNISDLSHKYGTHHYVHGGGGNTSVKTPTTLFVKPSGTTLADLCPNSFLSMNRKKINRLFEFSVPQNVEERENIVTAMLADAVNIKLALRPSVESPLHNIFKARYVVHTHPALVNGMTCAVNGKDACAMLFPDAMWLDYADPGYTLFRRCFDALNEWVREHRRQPQALFLENHGIFVAADTPETIDTVYTNIMNKLKVTYTSAEIPTVSALQPVECDISETLKKVYPSTEFAASKIFELPKDALTPDHIVYMKSKVFNGNLDTTKLDKFKQQYGYYPLIIGNGQNIITAGPSKARAVLTLQMAADASLIIRLTRAFGGVKYMSAEARNFIENWEAELYRSNQYTGVCPRAQNLS